MSGRYEHVLTLKFTEGKTEKISIVAPFEDVGNEINQEIETMEHDIKNIATQNILPRCALESQKLQRQMLENYGSNKSGKLSQSITIQNGSNVCSIGTDLFYAQYVNDGRGPVHVRNTRALHFNMGGKEIFVKSVGSASPRPYLDVSSEMLSSRIDDIVTNELSGI